MQLNGKERQVTEARRRQLKDPIRGGEGGATMKANTPPPPPLGLHFNKEECDLGVWKGGRGRLCSKEKENGGLLLNYINARNDCFSHDLGHT